MKKDRTNNQLIQADLQQQAEFLAKEGNLIKAIPIYRRLTELNSEESRYWIQLANTLVKVQKFDEAVISYQKVIEL